MLTYSSILWRNYSRKYSFRGFKNQSLGARSLLDSFVEAIANNMNVCNELEEHLSIIIATTRARIVVRIKFSFEKTTQNLFKGSGSVHIS